jgi:hypothetical protein
VSFTIFEKKDGLANTMGQFAKQFHHFATGRYWPTWYDEGRASWFGNADYGTVGFDGTKLTLGIVDHNSMTVRQLATAAAKDTMLPIAEVITKDGKALLGLSAESRKMWYVEAWALHAWLVDFAPDAVRDKFAQWQSVMEKLPTTFQSVEDTAFKEFLYFFPPAKDLPEMDRLFAEWVKKL